MTGKIRVGMKIRIWMKTEKNRMRVEAGRITALLALVLVFMLVMILVGAGCGPESPEAPETPKSSKTEQIPPDQEMPEPAELPVKAEGAAVFRKAPDAFVPLFADDLDFADLKSAVEGSLAWYRRMAPDTVISFGSDTYTAGHMADGLAQFLRLIETGPTPERLNEEILRHFHVYGFFEDDQPRNVLFTGYYEPLLRGSLEPGATFRYPLYSRPRDLVTINLSEFSPDLPKETLVGRHTGQAVVPYFSRQQIDGADALAGRADPIAWVDDPVDLFFLHVQGSGRLELDNGETRHIHFHISNGLPYRSIGKYLIDAGKISKEAVSMQSIRAYLKTRPDEMRQILDYNPRYIFFQTRNHGAKGCFAIELTPGRSIALDRRLFPPAALAFIQTQKPVTADDGAIREWIDFSRFVVNQDTGSAIIGPGRADIFWGHGPYAEAAAGHMKHPGQLFFLVARSPTNKP
jgi:membrane-bound lytic murein transglycosylase A